MKKIAVLGIDCQLGFMDLEALVTELLGPLADHPMAAPVKQRLMMMLGLALPVPGAHADMTRFAALINRIRKHIWKIVMTLDSHHVNQIFHPGFWRNKKGEMPGPFTAIFAKDIRDGVWLPRNANSKPPQLKGQTLAQYALWYAEQLEKGGKYILMVWPEHCLIGTPGHALHPAIAEATQNWEREMFGTVKFETKGSGWATEHFGVAMAEVPLAWDPSTQLNTGFIRLLAEADIILVGGEALSHCVKSSVDQIADNIGEEHISKFHILTDCTSPVPQVGGSPDFPQIGKDWLVAKEKQGMKLTTSVEFMSEIAA